jgi:surfeit locus 1 family protein
MMRRLIIPVIATLIMMGVLCGLGLWQLQRKAEKEALIAALDARTAAQPVPLPAERDWSALTPPSDEFRRVRFSATYRPGQPLVYAGGGSALRADVSGPGYWVFGAVALPSGASVVVNRGFAAEGQQGQIASATGDAEFFGVLRFSEAPGLFTPPEDRGKGLWFLRDHRAMAQANGWGEVAPFYVDLEQPSPPGGVPKPGAVHVNLRNEHLNYALTWFGLALVMLGSFAVWLVQQLRRRNPA